MGRGLTTIEFKQGELIKIPLKVAAVMNPEQKKNYVAISS